MLQNFTLFNFNELMNPLQQIEVIKEDEVENYSKYKSNEVWSPIQKKKFITIINFFL